MTEKKQDKVLYITHKVELLLWLIVILIVSVVFFFHTINLNKASNKYSIILPDADGLIVGSPVRAMGIEIGHVTKIKPTNDEIHLTFVIDDKKNVVPQGTIAAVEFSGMAGSKSLELYLPDKDTYIDSSVPIISIGHSKRLNEAFGLLKEMFKTLGNIIAVSSSFGTKLKEIDFPDMNKNTGNSQEFLKFANEIIDKSQERADNLGRTLNEYSRKK